MLRMLHQRKVVVDSMPSDNGWFSWASVALVVAAVDEEIAADAFQAADAAPVAAAGGHQKFVPPDVLVLDALKMAYHRLKTIVIYKPPIGLVALVVTARLVLSGCIF